MWEIPITELAAVLMWKVFLIFWCFHLCYSELQCDSAKIVPKMEFFLSGSSPTDYEELIVREKRVLKSVVNVV